MPSLPSLPTATRVLPALLLLIAAARPAAAQRGTTDDEWLANCRDSGGDYYSDGERGERFCDVRVERVRPRGRLTVDGRENGSVAVRGADGAEAVVHARITAHGRTTADAQAIARQVRITTRGDVVEAEGPSRGRGAQWWVSYLVEAPRRTDLEVTTNNGSISVREVAGRMELSAHNGSMSLADVGGDVHARTQNGSLNVRLAGRRWEGAGLDARTQNGSVRLEIPDGYGARLETGTVNGGFSSDVPLTLQGRIGRLISTQIGAGGPTVRATTTNGSVNLRRAE